MNKIALRNRIRKLARDNKGASMVEYCALLVLILVIAVVAYKALGQHVQAQTQTATASF